MPKTYEYNKKYVKTYMAKFERIGIKVPKGKRELLKSYAEKHSESVNELINRLIDAELGGAGPRYTPWSTTDGCRLTLQGRLLQEKPQSGQKAAIARSGGREHDAT